MHELLRIKIKNIDGIIYAFISYKKKDFYEFYDRILLAYFNPFLTLTGIRTF